MMGRAAGPNDYQPYGCARSFCYLPGDRSYEKNPGNRVQVCCL
jgi:hypothetical protein